MNIEGLDLKTYLATQALKGILANPELTKGTNIYDALPHIVDLAYAYAEQMLELKKEEL
jgi:hypothetical protein